MRLRYTAARSAAYPTVVGLRLTHPNIGVRTNDPTIRRLTTAPYPFVVFYEVTADEIVIHAIRHAARDPRGTPAAG